MNNVDKQIAVSRWIEEMDQKAKRDTRQRAESAPQVDLSGLSPSRALEAVFGVMPEPRQPKDFDPPPRDEHHGKAWASGLRLGQLRDGLTPTAPPAGPGAAAAPATVEPGQEPPARLSDVWEQLAAPPAAAAPVTPSAAVRAALQAMPEDQRAAVVQAVTARMGGLQHLGSASADYRQALIVGALAGRLADARKLDPAADAAAVIEALVPPASGDPAAEQGAGLP